MDLDAYRAAAESFYAERWRAEYRHLAGHEAQYPLEQIYDRHAALFERDAVLALQEQAQASVPGTDEHRRARMLWDFALDGHAGQMSKAIEEELARREVGLTISIDGGAPIGFREAPAVQANEPDADRRAAIGEARERAIAEQLSDLHRQLIESQHATAAGFGFASYCELCEHAKGLDLDALRAQTAAFARATDDRIAEVLDGELQRTVGLGYDQMRRSDIARLRRAAADDDRFPAATLMASLEATLRDLGIEPDAQSNVVFDLEPRPGKTPRAFCEPVRVPDEIYLVLSPVGGREDYAVLFHEAGHTEQFAHADPAMAFEFRCLGEPASTEVFAFLLQHLTDDPGWLERHLGMADGDTLRAFSRASRFVYLRTYAAKLEYELELHGGQQPLAAMADRYVDLRAASLGVPWTADTYLSDVDPGFYCAGYLRAWAFEAHLRRHLRDRFGERWFTVAEAGAALRSWWRDGMRLSAEERLAEVTGETLDFEVLVDDLGLR